MPTSVLKLISYAEIFAQKKSKINWNYTKYVYSKILPKNKIIHHHLPKFHSEKSGGAHCLQYDYWYL